MVIDIFILCFLSVTTRIASSLELQPGMPNVCTDQELSMLGSSQPCVQASTRMAKVWRRGCTGHSWCVGYERRTTYYTVYRRRTHERRTAYKCCPGWRHKDGEKEGCCLHRTEIVTALWETLRQARQCMHTLISSLGVLVYTYFRTLGWASLLSLVRCAFTGIQLSTNCF
ncbi:unnamed protein product [Boreogadus saida]